MKKMLTIFIICLGLLPIAWCSTFSMKQTPLSITHYDSCALYKAKGGTLTYIEWIKAGCPGLNGPEKGDKGDKGDKGGVGEVGPKGEKGENGTSFLTGHGVPSRQSGKNGDTYLDTDSFNIYYKQNASWGKVANIKGEEGQKGENGVSIVDVKIDKDGNLMVTMSDGTTINAGSMKTNTVHFFLGEMLIETQKIPVGEYATNITNVKGAFVRGWYQDPSFSIPWDFAHHKVDKDTNLYGDFKGKTFRVVFENDPASDTPKHALSSKLLTYGSPFSLPMPFDGSGEYMFKGWLKDDLDQGNRVLQKNDGIWDIDHDVTFYPMWVKKTKPSSILKAFIYPQSRVTNTSLISALKGITQRNLRYHIEYGGNEYSVVTATPGLNGSARFNDGTPIVEGQTYYFKTEPVEWLTLPKMNQDGKSLRITKRVLTAGRFHIDASHGPRAIHGEPIYSNNYKYSYLRARANALDGSSYGTRDFTGGGYPNDLFANNEFSKLASTAIDNSAKTTRFINNPYASSQQNTNDKIFVLSYEECNTLFSSSDERIGKPTDFALAVGVNYDLSSSDGSKWWTRSPYPENARKASIVDENGKLDSSAYVTDKNIGIRLSLYF